MTCCFMLRLKTYKVLSPWLSPGFVNAAKPLQGVAEIGASVKGLGIILTQSGSSVDHEGKTYPQVDAKQQGSPRHYATMP